MSPFTDEQLLSFNHLGIIPGPNESLEVFSKRAAYCLHLKTHLSDALKANLSAEENEDPEIFQHANNTLSNTYDITPNWIPLFFSNYQLTPWHGGCAWIFQIDENSPTAAMIQLRKNFCNSKKYLGIYDRNELITHELCHVGRMAFHERKFEEFLAYKRSTSKFRRSLGPMLQSGNESVIFILLLSMIIIFDIFLIMVHQPEAYAIAFWLKCVPLALIFYTLIRLLIRHKQLANCITNIERCIENKKKAEAIAYRLCDSEIIAFANMSPENIKTYATSQKELRWHVINKAYFDWPFTD